MYGRYVLVATEHHGYHWFDANDLLEWTMHQDIPIPKLPAAELPGGSVAG